MKIKIFHLPHVLTAATVLQHQLTKMGHDATLVSDVEYGDTTLYIMYCAINAAIRPINYVVYQTEVGSSHWFNDAYIDLIRGARAVWEYSSLNILKYQHCRVQTYIVEPGILKVYDLPEWNKRPIEVLHYGVLNERRKKAISQINAPVTIVEDLFGADMFEKLKQTKIVLNTHFYAGAPLEKFRVCEALSYGCAVISEHSNDVDRYGRYINAINFNGAVAPPKYLSDLDNFEQVAEAMKHFEFIVTF